MEDLPQDTSAKPKKINRQKHRVLNQISREDIRLVYTFVKKNGHSKRLGKGSFGTVRIAYKTVNPTALFAVKSIKREQFE